MKKAIAVVLTVMIVLSTFTLFVSANNVSFGDVNEDGKVSVTDVIYILQSLNGKRTLSAQALKNADVNNDSIVNYIDLVLLRQYLVNIYKSLPITDYAMYGDLDESGNVSIADVIYLSQYLENIRSLSPQALKNADVNDDGLVNYVDIVLLRQYLVNTYETLPITDYIVLGDVDESGNVSIADVTYLSKHLKNTRNLSPQALKNADMNNDGLVDSKDLIAIFNYLDSQD